MYKSSKIIKFEIVTPERIVLKDMAIKITVPTQEGELTILPKHQPLIGILKPGVIIMQNEKKQTKIMAVSGGFIEVLRNKVVVLADTAERAEEIDLERADEARKKVIKYKDSFRTVDKERFTSINAAIAKELARTKAVKRWKKIKIK